MRAANHDSLKDAIKALSQRDCDEIYRFAMQRSDEIKKGLKS